MPNQNKQEVEWKEKFDKKFKEEPKCEHGHTFSHYTCEPHDYPHVIGNRFGPDCERCTPPRKQTLEDIKSFIEQTIHQEVSNREEEIIEMIKSIPESDDKDLVCMKTGMNCMRKIILNRLDFAKNCPTFAFHPTNNTKETK